MTQRGKKKLNRRDFVTTSAAVEVGTKTSERGFRLIESIGVVSVIAIVLLLASGICITRTSAKNPNHTGHFQIGVSIYDGPAVLTTVRANGSRPNAGSLLDGGLITQPIGVVPVQGIELPVRLLDFHVCNPSGSCNTSIAVRNGRAEAKLTYHSDAVQRVSHYRVAETESALRSAAWIRIPKAIFKGTEKSEQPIDFTFDVGNIPREIEKHLFFQVQAGSAESNILSDSTFLRNDPTALAQYEITGNELKELLRFAKDQGFTVMKVVENETNDPVEKASPSEGALLRDLSIATCCAAARVMRLQFFTGHSLNTPWKVKDIDIAPTTDCIAGLFANPQFSFILGFPTVTFRNGVLRNSPASGPPKAVGGFPGIAPPPVACLGCGYPLRKIILEGPASLADSIKPWKAAFQR